MRRLWWGGLLGVAVSTACGGNDSTAASPNILLIVADDMGYTDVGF